MHISYGIKTAVKGMAHEKWINLLSIMTVASSLLIMIFACLLLYNIEHIASTLHERFGMVAFLDDRLQASEIQAIIERIKQRQEIEGLRYISKEDALKELKERLKEDSYIFDGLDYNPLSPAIELRLKRQYITPQQVASTAKELKAIKGVSEVYSAEKVAEIIEAFYRSLSNFSLILLSALGAGIIFVVYSTVKILFYRRKEEIETIKLLGATRGFIRMPFLVEGGIIGLFGGLLSVGLSLLVYFAVTYRLSSGFPLLETILYPTEIALSFPLSGAILGLLGAFIAVGRLRF
jgi:cell division transport system permease protein